MNTKNTILIAFSILIFSCNTRSFRENPENLSIEDIEYTTGENLSRDELDCISRDLDLSDENLLFRRKVTKRNWKALFKNGVYGKDGVVAVKIAVNPDGDVVYTEIIEEETTVTNKDQLFRALRAAMGYKVEADPNAKSVECGKLVFDLNVSTTIK